MTFTEFTAATLSDGSTIRIFVDRTANTTPRRDWDWRAIAHDYEPGHPVGLGATPGEAAAKLVAEIELDFER